MKLLKRRQKEQFKTFLENRYIVKQTSNRIERNIPSYPMPEIGLTGENETTLTVSRVPCYKDIIVGGFKVTYSGCDDFNISLFCAWSNPHSVDLYYHWRRWVLDVAWVDPYVLLGLGFEITN